MTAGSEGNIAGHDQPKRIALTTNLYPSALQLFAQLGLLAVHVITHAPTYGTTRNRTGYGTPCAVGPAGTGRTDHGPGDRSHSGARSEEHTSELQSRGHLVCRLLLDKKNSWAQTYTQLPS